MANYTITNNLTNVDMTSFSGIISPDVGHIMPTSITVSGCTLINYNSTTGEFALSNVTNNAIVSAICPEQQTSYIIPAGTYYGKDNPDGYLGEFFPMNFTVTFLGNTTYYNGMYISSSSILYGEFVQDTAWLDDDGWTLPLRTITIGASETVTQERYNAFSACFDYAFALHATGDDNVYYPFSPLGMTWQQFVQSSYNDGNFSISNNNVVQYGGAGIYYYFKPGIFLSAYSTDTISTSIEYIYSGGAGSN